MARKKRGNPVHGWVYFHKPYGMTSTQAVGFVKRVYDAQKAGHGGTLDPLASGVLPIALGEATKTMPYMLTDDKTYQFTVIWGEERNTDDAEGEAVATSTQRPTRAQIEEILPDFTGPITQTPPAFSAIKIDGKPAYQRVRGGEDVAMPSRDVTIHTLTLLDVTPESATFEAHVSKGTYIRALGRDMGRKLGCYGYIGELIRTQIGQNLTLNACVSKETLDSCLNLGQDALQFLRPVGDTLADIPAYVANVSEETTLKRGQTFTRVHLAPGLMRVVRQRNGQLISLVDVDDEGTLHIIRNFKLEDEDIVS